tara:strand:- start:9930 stop:10973 length:1044 start_codon:yes stop_codon:yes gene_type:complete
MERINQLQEIHVKKKDGIKNYIPFAFPKMSSMIPGIIKGTPYIISAGTGVGKTQLTKYLAVINSIEYAIENNVDLKILYFALEESIEEFTDSLLTYLIQKDSGVQYSVLDLQGISDNEVDFNIVRKSQAKLEQFLDYLEIVDFIYNPTGIFKYVYNYAETRGTHVKVSKEGEEYYDHYVPNNPDEHIIVICDHVSLLNTEKGNSQMQTILKYSVDYSRKMFTKKFNYSSVIVQQQANVGEDIAHAKANALEPRLNNLADAKSTKNDALIVLGVFDPFRHDSIVVKNNFRNINLKKWAADHGTDALRSINIMKNRYGNSNKVILFKFNGATNNFIELTNEDREKYKFI